MEIYEIKIYCLEDNHFLVANGFDEHLQLFHGHGVAFPRSVPLDEGVALLKREEAPHGGFYVGDVDDLKNNRFSVQLKTNSGSLHFYDENKFINSFFYMIQIS
jgi:hypothetical protein